MLTGKAKTDYMREYMRRRRANARSNQPRSNPPFRATVRPVRPQKELTYEKDDYSQ